MGLYNAICTVSAAPVKKENSHRAEMVNQLLFGETVDVVEEREEWLHIKSTYDGYEGWLTNHMIAALEAKPDVLSQHFVTTGLMNPLTLPNQLVNLPMGSTLTGFDEETRLLWDGQHKYHGTYRDTKKAFDEDLLLRTVHAWLNAPYLWGGRTFMGVDCSGFVQVVYKVLGIKLFRDAYQQAEQGEQIKNLADAKLGDLGFFVNAAGRIIHVGLMMDAEKIIHASGKVRIDKIDEEGITNTDTGKRTHQLVSIRRYF